MDAFFFLKIVQMDRFFKSAMAAGAVQWLQFSLVLPFRSKRAVHRDKVEIETSQSKSGTSLNLSNSGERQLLQE